MNLVTEQAGNPRVTGYCPNGCGKTLFLGDNGYVTCSYLECREPDIVSTLLESRLLERTVLQLFRRS